MKCADMRYRRALQGSNLADEIAEIRAIVNDPALCLELWIPILIEHPRGVAGEQYSVRASQNPSFERLQEPNPCHRLSPEVPGHCSEGIRGVQGPSVAKVGYKWKPRELAQDGSGTNNAERGAARIDSGDLMAPRKAPSYEHS